MVALLGMFVVVGSVLGGFLMAGGPVLALFVPGEFLIIGGTAVGTVLISTPRRVLVHIAAKVKTVLGGSPYSGAYYLTALVMLYELFQLARKDGLIALESHIEKPDQSSLFARYPGIRRDPRLLSFVCDSLRLVLLGSVPPHDLEALLDAEIEVHQDDDEQPVTALTKVADALPGIGIVAAVLGIVVTMQSIAGPIEEIGQHVASALVGTFTGILLSYGFIHPVASSIEMTGMQEVRMYHALKAGIVALAKGLAPLVAVEFARRAIPAEERPSFREMEEACKRVKAAK
jgi:chemotaxis protein MotA